MKTTISDRVYIQNPDLVLDYWKKRLTYKINEEEHQTYKYDEEKDLLVIPRGVLERDKTLGEVKIETVQHKYDFGIPKFTLYDYQKEAIEELEKYTQGILQSPCGSGKTVMFISYICKMKQTTLVLVDELKIQKQWQTELKRFLGKKTKVGLIGDGKFSIEPITIATVQTLRNIDEEKWKKINKYFGIILVEECHMTPAETIYRVINKTKAHYRLGMTATPNRRDKLEFYMFDAIGPIVYKVDESKLDRVPIVIKPVYTKMFFSVKFPTDENWIFWKTYVTKKLMEKWERNNLIVSQILEHNSGLHLVLSERVDHCKTLAKMLQDKGLKTKLLIGGIKSAQREKLRKDKTIDVIVGTKVADKALDIPRIRYVHLTMPTANKAKLEQRIGRGARSCEGKDLCLIFDYVDVGIIEEDKGIDYFTASFRTRVVFYKKKGYFFRASKVPIRED